MGEHNVSERLKKRIAEVEKKEAHASMKHAVKGGKDYARNPAKHSNPDTWHSGLYTINKKLSAAEEYRKQGGDQNSFKSLTLLKDAYRSLDKIDEGAQKYDVDKVKKAILKRVDRTGKKIGQSGLLESAYSLSKIIEHDLNAESDKKNGFLERIASIGSIVAVGVGIFLISPTLTGNVIGNLNKTSLSLLGVILFVLGLIGAFLLGKKYRK